MVAERSEGHTDHLMDAYGADVLKTSVIYGANAAGKSSVIKAMGDSRDIILGGDLRKCSDRYCRHNKEYRTKPTMFGYTVKDGDGGFEFGFETVLSENRLVSEWLYLVENEKKPSPVYTAELKDGSMCTTTLVFPIQARNC